MKEWFPHDYTSASDPKIRALIRRCGYGSYGLYWHFVEILHAEQTMEYEVAIDSICMGLNAPQDAVEAFFKHCFAIGLIDNEDGVLSIDRVNRNLEHRDNVTERRKKAAAKRWSNVDKTDQKNANAMQKSNLAMQNYATTLDNITLDNITKEKNNNNVSMYAPTSFEVVANLPQNDGNLFQITKEQYDRWQELYPAVNVKSELSKIIGWLEANPSRRKTKRGMLSFVNRWLSKEQDRGAVNAPQSKKYTVGDRQAVIDYKTSQKQLQEERDAVTEYLVGRAQAKQGELAISAVRRIGDGSKSSS